jgi:Sec-independent protein translocase protein TatA
LFGAKKLPELSRSIGESIREVRKGFRDEPAAHQTSKTNAGKQHTKA